MGERNRGQLLAKRALQIQRGSARAAVLGVNDGLVSILCLVVTVAAAGAHSYTVLLAGFAGLLAGAVSMAAGEWISVQAQVELFRGVLVDIKILLAKDKPLLIKEVEESLIKAGQSVETAQTAAREIAGDTRRLTEFYAREVMGFNPNELGSPWRAALSSFLLFTVGAFAPLAPWIVADGLVALWLSIGLTAAGSLVVGGYIAISSGRNVLIGATRQLLIVVFASVVTYGLGYLFGVSVV